MLFSKNDGYRVKLRGRAQVEYIENKKRIMIDSEFLADEAGIILYSSSIKHWEPPYESEVLSDFDLMKIKNNVLSDLAKHDIKAEWD